MTRRSAPALRLFHSPDCVEECAPIHTGGQARSYAQEATVSMRLGDLLPILAMALRGGYMWVEDFADDEVRVTEDFYQVLRAFEEMRALGQEVC